MINKKNKATVKRVGFIMAVSITGLVVLGTLANRFHLGAAQKAQNALANGL